jgi:hypothetical protein
MRGDEVVGVGTIMPNFQQMHGYPLTTGWKAVSITTLYQKPLECWKQYPTHDNTIEEGSFSAWPEDRLEYDFEGKGKKTC